MRPQPLSWPQRRLPCLNCKLCPEEDGSYLSRPASYVQAVCSVSYRACTACCTECMLGPGLTGARDPYRMHAGAGVDGTRTECMLGPGLMRPAAGEGRGSGVVLSDNVTWA